MMGITSMAEKHVLNKIIKSLYLFSDEITVTSLISDEKLQEILQNELINNPELFFVNGFKLMYSPVATVVYPSYSYAELEFKTILDSCRKIANQLVSRIEGKDNYSRVLQAHDFIARNVIYVNGISKELHTIVAPLTKKQGVCEGYAKTFKYLLDMMDIPCLIVSGIGYDPEKDIEESHAWNLINLDGNWIHIDVTFDTTIRNGNVLRYDYFGLTNEQILKDHRYEVDKYPVAEHLGYGYYKRYNLEMKTRKQVNELVLNTMRSEKKDCVFKLPDSSNEENLDIKVSSEVNALLKQLGLNIQYTMLFNIKQRVFHIHFEK